jgi:hypothetical protein
MVEEVRAFEAGRLRRVLFAVYGEEANATVSRAVQTR